MSRRLVVLNQSQSPAFQQLLEVASAPAAVEFLTGAPFDASRAGVTIRQGPAYDRTSLRHRAASWARFLAWAAAGTLRSPNDAFYLAVTNPPLLPHLAFGLAKIKASRFGVLVWDIYPHHLVTQGWAAPRAPWVRAWHGANRVALSKAAFVVTLGDAMAATLRAELHSLRTDHVHVIPMAVATDVLKPRNRRNNPACERMRVSEDALVVMYSGNLGSSHGLDALLGAAERLKSDSRFRFLVVGQGLGRPAIERQIAARTLTNVALHDPVPWTEVPDLLSLADVAVVAQAPGTEHLAVPSKTYSSLAVGSAILALTSFDSDLADVVKQHSVGAVHSMNDVDGVLSTLTRWATDSKLLTDTKRRARRLAETHYSNEAVVNAWAALLQPELKS